MSKPEKIFKSTTDQLEILQQRGLVINDPMFAEEALVRTSYYEIINGYKDLFIDVNVDEERFQTGTTFSEIYYLYELDNTLRFATLSATLSAETLLRSVIAYVLAEEHWHSVKDYQHNRNFRQGKKIMHGRQKENLRESCCCRFFLRSIIPPTNP